MPHPNSDRRQRDRNGLSNSPDGGRPGTPDATSAAPPASQAEYFAESGNSPPQPRVGNLGALAARWRKEAERLRTLEANGPAAAFEQAARELDEAAAAWASEPLTISEAAAESGYTEEHLRRLARRGELPAHRNGGPKSRIQVRRGDLPMKRRKDGRGKPERVTYDPDEDARSIAQLLEARP